MTIKLGLHSGYMVPEAVFDRWLVAAADVALNDSRFSSEEVKMRLKLDRTGPRKQWRRGEGSMPEG